MFTEFLLHTCRLSPRVSKRDMQAAMLCGVKATTFAKNEVVPIITGSVAEFYIEPMLPHIGDIDVMFYRTDLLAIPRGHPPPTQLPPEFHNYVKVYEIVDGHLPGFVYLELRYLRTECSGDIYMPISVDCGKGINLVSEPDATSTKLCLLTETNQKNCPLILFNAYVVCRGRHKPLIGQHTQKLRLVRLSNSSSCCRQRL